MELHGAVIAIVPSRSNPNEHTVHCIPLAFSNKVPDDFRKVMNYRELSELAFREKINLLDRKDVQLCFARLADVLGELVTLQELSCENASKDYQPIALRVGQDRSAPINGNSIYRQLFGKRFCIERRPVDLVALNEELEKYEIYKSCAERQYYYSGERVVSKCIDSLFGCLQSKEVFEFQVCKKLNSSPLFFLRSEKILISDLYDRVLLTEKLIRSLREHTQRTGNDYYPLTRLFCEITGRSLFSEEVINAEKRSSQSLEIPSSDQVKIRHIAEVFAFHRLIIRRSRLLPPCDITSHSPLPNFSEIESRYIQFRAHLNQQAELNDSTPTAEPSLEYMAACSKFAAVLERSTLNWGSFNNSSGMDLRHRQFRMKEEEDARHASGDPLVTDPNEFYRSIDQARKSGARLGLFQNLELPVFYSPIEVAELPEARVAFHQSFQKAYKGPHSRWVKVFLDPPAPFFVDPMMWTIFDQYQILFGSRFPDDIEDQTKRRLKIARDAASLGSLSSTQNET